MMKARRWKTGVATVQNYLRTMRQLNGRRLLTENRLPAGALAANLGLQVAGFAAGTAIVGAVFAQADLIKTLAQHAVLVAGAGPF